MNSHNKPKKKAIHANNHPMEVAFHSAPGLSTSLQAVGFEMDVAQLSRGRLEGELPAGWFAGRKYNAAHCMVFMPA